jgi:hypothetical protein
MQSHDHFPPSELVERLDGFGVIAEPCVPASDGPLATLPVPAVSHNGTANGSPAGPENGHSRTPFSPARQELARAQAALEHANAALRRCQEPIARLEAVIADVGNAERELEKRHHRYHAVLGEWYAGGAITPRPGPDPELLAAERQLVAAQADAVAVRSVIADHSAVAQKASEAVRVAVARRDAAFRTAVVDALQQYINEHLIPAYQRAQTAELPVVALEQHFTASGDTASAAQIREIAQRARASCTPPDVDATAGAAFIAALHRDAAAELGV